MKNKKFLLIALVFALLLPQAACSSKNTSDQKQASVSEESKKEENKEENNTEENKEEKDPMPARDCCSGAIPNQEEKSEIYQKEFSYLPEGFVENFSDNKKDLRTVEYVDEKNPAKKITLQLCDNDDTFKEFIKVADETEEIDIADQKAQFWDDGAFRYILLDKGTYKIYARSTLDKEETIKIVQEIK